jgi:hypothetical protein
MSVSGKESATSIRFYSRNIVEGKKRKMRHTLTNQMTGFANEETPITEESMTINVQKTVAISNVPQTATVNRKQKVSISAIVPQTFKIIITM